MLQPAAVQPLRHPAAASLLLPRAPAASAFSASASSEGPRRAADDAAGVKLLPGGVPNTATRRLMFRIRRATSLRQLAATYRRHRGQSGVWEPRHAAAVLMRAARLLYYRCGVGWQDWL